MRLGTRLTGAKLAFLAWFGPTGGAPNLKCLFFGDFHGYIMGVYEAGIWSILTSNTNTRTRVFVCWWLRVDSSYPEKRRSVCGQTEWASSAQSASLGLLDAMDSSGG